VRALLRDSAEAQPLTNRLATAQVTPSDMPLALIKSAVALWEPMAAPLGCLPLPPTRW